MRAAGVRTGLELRLCPDFGISGAGLSGSNIIKVKRFYFMLLFLRKLIYLCACYIMHHNHTVSRTVTDANRLPLSYLTSGSDD